MSDYAKPVGWWCSCAPGDVIPAGYFGHRDRSGTGWRPRCFGSMKAGSHGLRFMVPVFAETPAGQRPEAEEPDDVIASFDRSGNCDRWLHAVGAKRDAVRQSGRWYLYENFDPNSAEDADLVGHGTEADAVLFVVEGVLP